MKTTNAANVKPLDFIEIKEVARMACVSVSSVRTWIRGYYVKDGVAIKSKTILDIPIYGRSQKYLFKRKDVEDWLLKFPRNNTRPMLP